MILYYREHNGDFFAIDTATNAYYRQVLGQDHYEGRASAIRGQVGSVCTTSISRQYLREKSRRVARVKVPLVWLKAIGLHEEEGP